MRLNNISDDMLIDMYSKGCNRAFDFIVRRYRYTIQSYIRLRITDRHLAEDIFQEVFIKAMLSIKDKKYNPQGKFKQWLQRLAGNVIIDFFRREKSSFNQFYDYQYLIASDSIQDDENDIYTDITSEYLTDKLEALSEEQKSIVKMKYWDGLSFKDIAKEKNISINTALGRMRYAIINLRKTINESYYQY